MRRALWSPGMTEPEDRNVSAEQAVERGWAKLRRALAHKRENPEAQKWRDINDRNNFGPGFFRFIQDLGPES